MTKKENYVHGQFCWVDLQTPDPAAAKTFYSQLFGWESFDVPTARGPAYTMFLHNGLATAGMGPQPPEMKGAPPIRGTGKGTWRQYLDADHAGYGPRMAGICTRPSRGCHRFLAT